MSANVYLGFCRCGACVAFCTDRPDVTEDCLPEWRANGYRIEYVPIEQGKATFGNYECRCESDAFALGRERDALAERVRKLEALIAKSSLVEVPCTRVDKDSCGKPILVRDGVMLVHEHAAAREEETTRRLQQMANQARRIVKLEAAGQQLAEAICGIVNQMEEPTPYGDDNIEEWINEALAAWEAAK
jgi:hypothetical protein